jgi:plastocyanin
MRTVVLAAAAVLALAVTGASQTASTATKAVAIKAAGFQPATVTIATGDAVKWTNRDTKTHQVVANNGSFASAVIRPGNGYTHVFRSAGTFRYHDALHPALTGKVVVKGPPPAVTIGAALPILLYGQETHISGVVSSGNAGERVTVWAQPYGQASYAQIAVLTTTTNGVWDYVVKPTLLTNYTARWKSTASDPIGVQLRPNVLFSVTKRAVGFVRVKTDRSLAGRKVYVQRFTRFHQWVKMRKVILGAGSQKRFKMRLKPGRYTLRIFMSLNQVGAGYLDGFSQARTFRRR